MYKWDPVITGTDRPKKFGRINKSFLQENVWLFCRAAKKKVALITRWPYYHVSGQKQGFTVILKRLKFT